MKKIDEAERLLSRMAVPKNSLGLIDQQLRKVIRAWGHVEKDLRPYHIVFAADNGVVCEGVVRQPQEITYLQARNMTRGLSAISCFCACNNVPLEVVDVGINNAESVGTARKIARGTHDFLEGPAMSESECERAYAVGRERAAAAIAGGANIISLGEMGIGNTTTSAAVLHAISGIAARFLVGYGGNPTHPEIIPRKAQVVADGVAKYRDHIKTPLDAIRYVGGFDIAALTGAIVECAESKIPVVLDGFITAVAFACAAKIDPRATAVAIPSHLSREPGARYALELGGITADEVPIRAGLALGEGTGAILALTMLRTMHYTALHIDRMATMDAEAAAMRPQAAVLS